MCSIKNLKRIILMRNKLWDKYVFRQTTAACAQIFLSKSAVTMKMVLMRSIILYIEADIYSLPGVGGE